MYGIFFILIKLLLVKCNGLYSDDDDIIPANNLDQYIRYASHVYVPNLEQPIIVSIYIYIYSYLQIKCS